MFDAATFDQTPLPQPCARNIESAADMHAMMFQLLGENFCELTLENALQVAPLLRDDPQPLSGYTPSTLAAWNGVYKYGWAHPDGGPLLISCKLAADEPRHLLQPVGPFPAAAQQRLLAAMALLPYPVRIYGMSPAFLERYPHFASHFSVTTDPASANYVYSAAELSELPGRKFHQKRNLIVQAAGLYKHTVEPLTVDNVKDCFTVLAEMDRDDNVVLQGSLANERVALLFTLNNYAAMGQSGLVLRVDGAPVAFTIFEKLTPDTGVVHFEKARRSYKGIYQVLNKESATVMHQQMGLTFINREEDLGNEGLKRAKESYNPVELKPSHMLTFGKPA